MLEAADLLIASPAIADVAELEPGAIAHMNADHSEAVDLYARVFGKSRKAGWRVCGIDCAGLDLANGDELLRIEFDAPLSQASELRSKLAELSRLAREN